MASQPQPTATVHLNWPAAWLARLGRQMLLVPEAILLLTLLCIHATFGPSPALVALGVGVALWFSSRVTLLYIARRDVGAARYKRAGSLARLALRLYPLSADAHALLGTVSLSLGDAAAACQALGRAVRYYPLQADLHVALSAALIEAGKPREALTEAEAALRIDPGYAPAHLQQAGAEELLGAPAELVERHLRAGLEQPSAPADEAALRCGLARALLSRGCRDEARRELARAEQLLPATWRAQRAGLHYQIGETLRISGQPEAAREHFSASESLDPQGPYAADAWRAARS